MKNTITFLTVTFVILASTLRPFPSFSEQYDCVYHEVGDNFPIGHSFKRQADGIFSDGWNRYLTTETEQTIILFLPTMYKEWNNVQVLIISKETGQMVRTKLALEDDELILSKGECKTINLDTEWN